MGAAIEIVDYRPSNELDAELAELSFDATRGCPDQRPMAPSLIRARLRPLGLTATTLVLHRDPTGRLLGVASLRWPAGPDLLGQVWGPVVDPSVRGHGVATALLAAIEEVVAARPRVRLCTVGIAESRPAGSAVFERAGWELSGRGSLFSRLLPAAPGGAEDEVAGVLVRNPHTGEYVDPALAELFAGARPELNYASARDTFTRWSSDERYRADGLLLAEPVFAPYDGPLLGAALVYPLQRPGGDGPVEANLADLLLAAHLDPAGAGLVRSALVAAFVVTGARLGATVARAVARDPELTDELLERQFTVVDRIRYYTRPDA